jgi:Flp pilus assembly protein TadD
MRNQARTRIRESDIRDPEFFSSRGVEKFNENDYDGAINDFDRAITLDSDNPNYFNLRGHARYSKGDLRGARSDFNRSKKLKTKTKKQRKNAAS